MIVVADTTPLNYLILIDEVEVLPFLYTTVLIPTQVLLELQHAKTPSRVRAWAAQLPSWCRVKAVGPERAASLRQLDAGESEAIQLAMNVGAELVLLDDAEGRQEAIRHHLRVAGTVSVLEAAAQRGLVDFRAALAKLDGTSFRLSSSLREAFLRRNP